MDLSVRLLVTAAVLIAPPTTFAADAGKLFVNSKFGYTMTIPAKWNMDYPESGVPVLFNYKRSDGGPQGLFPDHGAHMFLIRLEAVKISANAKTLDEWIQCNLQRDHSNSSIKQLSDLDPNPSSPRNIVEVQADFVRDEQDEEKQSEVNYYFTLNGAAFRREVLSVDSRSRAS